MSVTDEQVRIMMQERSKGRSQEQAAAKANVRARQTVSKYEQLEEMPSGLKQARTYRTRKDPFEADWSELEEMLRVTPELEAKTLLDWLCEQKPNKYHEGQLRTLQRRVSNWRVMNEPQVAVLEQIHRPGEIMQTDGTWLTKLGVTVQGVPFEPALIHSVLTYSNWEWGRLARSESLAALQLGIQSTLFKLGHVPEYHQTDNSTAATYRLGAMAGDGEERGYTTGYLQLLEHYGLQPRVIHVGRPQENGDIESSNGGLKRAIEQHLLLRGSREFEGQTSYEEFILRIMDKRNRPRQERLVEELAVMTPLQATALATRRKEEVPVSRGSLIRVMNNSYSVPTNLKGKKVTVYIHEWWLEVYYGRKLIERIPRLSGRNKHQINYRHLIDSLLRKPGGFRNYRYRDQLFPKLIFRQAWEQLDGWYAPRKADMIYLRALNLAARTLESEVACGLELLVNGGERWDETDLEQLLQPGTPTVPQLTRPAVSLAQYDQLLPEVA